MHETVIAKGIIEECRKHGHVEAVFLEIGELAHVPAEELVECLKGLVDWEVHHTEIPARARCSCGFEGHPSILERGHDHFMIECPDCGSVPELVAGTEIKIAKVRVK